LAYADDVNLQGDNIDTINKNTETLTDASKDVDLEVSVEKTKYMLVSRDRVAAQLVASRVVLSSTELISYIISSLSYDRIIHYK
jgi:hypothetical protein